jgi:hypothetical protein
MEVVRTECYTDYEACNISHCNGCLLAYILNVRF